VLAGILVIGSLLVFNPRAKIKVSPPAAGQADSDSALATDSRTTAPLPQTDSPNLQAAPLLDKTVSQNAAAAGRSRPPPPVIEDPEARHALNYVGLDKEAEARWIAAINNPELSDHERSDLIEDLNEEGFSDPKNPTQADLVLIVSRMVLIEQLIGTAMDKTNEDAFKEAYKDLANMYIRLTEQ
jgi:hypothetical protein